MKKLVLSVAAVLCFWVAGVNAQVTVTYKVDITEYLNTTPVGANGIRIGGNFAAFQATNGSNPMVDWSPSNEFSAMTEGADNIWSITVTYPASAIGQTQLYKFVNNDWGTNEGAQALVTGGCAADDGGGNINRQLVIPANNSEVCFIWDACTPCGPVSVKKEVKNLFSVGPNPTTSALNIRFGGSAQSEIKMVALDGRVVKSILTSQSGDFTHTLDVSDLNAGMYYVTVVDGSIINKTPVVIVK